MHTTNRSDGRNFGDDGRLNQNVLCKILIALSKVGQERNFRKVADYSMPNVSEKMVRIILSYTDYIKEPFGANNDMNVLF
jgi:UDP-N-acetylglucosamine 2-epimerase